MSIRECMRGRPPVLALAIASLAMGALGGCGSNGGDCDGFTPNFEACVPTLTISPARRTLQVGGTVTFTATASLPIRSTLKWRKSSDNGVTWADIPGAIGTAYTLAGAQLPDDGALFTAEPTSSKQIVSSFPAQLSVSSMPGVVIADGEFRMADWTATPLPGMPTDESMESIEHVPADGNPGAYRRMVDPNVILPDSSGSVHLFQGAGYDPVVQGGVHVIDYTEDCRRVGGTASTSVVSTLLMKQDGRTYWSGQLPCSGAAWQPLTALTSMPAAHFQQIAGPACQPGLACPDFAATAAPMRFGYARVSQNSSSMAPIAVEHHIDNWSVTVWRH